MHRGAIRMVHVIAFVRFLSDILFLFFGKSSQGDTIRPASVAAASVAATTLVGCCRQFGERLAVVKNAETAVTSFDVGAERSTLQRQLAQLSDTGIGAQSRQLC